MSLVDDLLPTLSNARGLIGEFGLRPYTVTRQVHSWSGTYPGEGTETVTETEITENGQPPKVRKPKDEEIALQQMASGDFVVGPITPSFGGGGYTPIELDGGSSLAAGEVLTYKLVGPDIPNGNIFAVKAIHADDPFGYMLHLSPLAES